MQCNETKCSSENQEVDSGDQRNDQDVSSESDFDSSVDNDSSNESCNEESK